MKNKVRNTSVESFHDLDNVGKKQMNVLNALKYELKTACNLDLADFLDWPINHITPRVNELVKNGFLQEDRRDICVKTGRKVIFWRITLKEPEQLSFV